MLMKNKTVIILFLFLIIFTSAVCGKSLWSEDSSGFYNDYPDYSSGDIITVVIEEDASAIQTANTDTNQSSSVDGSAGTGFFDFLKSFGFGYSDSDSADGQTQRSGTLTADITTEIVGVNKNGNLKIEGKKVVKINGETQTIKLSGVVRPEDVDFENNVSSKNIAQAEIEYEGEGPVGDKQKPGLLGRLFNFIF